MLEIPELDSGSAQSVAYQLADKIAAQEKLYDEPASYRQAFLDLYAECLNATYGRRETSGS